MQFLTKCGWTALLILVQPIKVLASVIVVTGAVSAECGREFYTDVKRIWSDQ